MEHELADGARMHVEVFPGTGTPILLAHAILASSAAWRRVATHLAAAGRTVLLPDDRGHGASTPDVTHWAPLAAAEDIEHYLRTHHPNGAHLVGHSRGATSVSWIAANAPELAQTLTVVNSPPQASEAFRATFRRQGEALGPEASPRTRAALAYLATIPEDDFPAYALRRYPEPALVIESEDDPLYSPTATLFWRAFLPYADFERVPGGHAFFAEDETSAKWLAERILAHVKKAESAVANP